MLVCKVRYPPDLWRRVFGNEETVSLENWSKKHSLKDGKTPFSHAEEDGGNGFDAGPHAFFDVDLQDVYSSEIKNGLF
ncbi:MAG: hypothetical protein HON98_10050 [Chloroflexi bacterium]|jgi:hypothetical protein|nr:hypothetical protein [Chloroflexota bacterium]MBT3670885.1 hypothetical protein [Chloroflexota bacterium]MBT4002926.1 hypothetical protein [Chloroflexota bacterium]MBT4306401.1 hypothetical protein [Chloroflexota bacterium]MBT4532718.1 hypothetical protein [Chloroflexota bacterium]